MNCQVCGSENLELVLSLGQLPTPNNYRKVDDKPNFNVTLPTDLYCCRSCDLVQLGYIAAPSNVFPLEYPYTSGTTKALHDNFTDLAEQCRTLGLIGTNSLVVDIGSNDGTLLSKFKDIGVRVVGIEPTDTAKLAQNAGIPTYQGYFDLMAVDHVLKQYGQADLVTCTNCFAHMPEPNDVMAGIKMLLTPKGTFISESQYLYDMLDNKYYDTIYHEHLRYYSIASLANLFVRNGMFISRVKKIPTHGGSIRVFANRNEYKFDIASLGATEASGTQLLHRLHYFAGEVHKSRWGLLKRLITLRLEGKHIVGLSAPSRAATVINYCHLDRSYIDYVVELPGSLKMGCYMPGTDIPVVPEQRLYNEQPDCAIVFSHHLGGALTQKIRSNGYRGSFIHPL